eukprot:4169113-Pyramimonas_sp.AAC.1
MRSRRSARARSQQRRAAALGPASSGQGYDGQVDAVLQSSPHRGHRKPSTLDLGLQPPHRSQERPDGAEAQQRPVCGEHHARPRLRTPLEGSQAVRAAGIQGRRQDGREGRCQEAQAQAEAQNPGSS